MVEREREREREEGLLYKVHIFMAERERERGEVRQYI